jgi:asparagine synthase (glutamine-hydrolysing)
MHFSLEVRVPFISQEVYNFAQALPDIWKLGPKDFQSIDGSYQATGEKFVLQQLAKRYLPESILQRKKQGFELPLDELLKGPLLKIAEEKFSTSNLEKFEFFNRDQFLRLFNEFQNGNVPAIQIWLILVFILWYESIMPDHSYD